QWQPIDRALRIAIRFTLAVAIEDVERHAIEVDESLAPGGVGAGRWDGLCQRGERNETGDAAAKSGAKSRNACDPHPSSSFLHDAQSTSDRLHTTINRRASSLPASAAPAAENGFCNPSCASRGPSSRDTRKQGPCFARARYDREPYAYRANAPLRPVRRTNRPSIIRRRARR